MVCNGPNWCPVGNMLRQGEKTGKTVLSDLQTFFVTNRHLKNLVREPIFPLSQFEHTFYFAVSVCFLCTNMSIWRRKNFIVCIYAVILIFLLSSKQVVYKMSVSHANKLWKYTMYLILFEYYWFWIIIFLQKLSFQPNKFKKFICNMRQEIQNRCKKVSVSHKMFAPIPSLEFYPWGANLNI